MIKESSTSSEKRSEKRKRTHRANHPHKSVGALPIEWSWHSVSKCTFLHQPCGEQGFWTLCGRTALTLLPSQRWWAIDYFFVSPPFSILPLLRKYLLINYHHHRNCMHFYFELHFAWKQPALLTNFPCMPTRSMRLFH